MRSITCRYISLVCVLIAHGHAYSRQDVTVETVTEPFGLTEGPHWDHRSQKLYFVDIINQRIYRLDTATGVITNAYIENGTVGVVVRVDDSTDELVAGVGTDLVLITWDGDQNETDVPTEVLCSVDTDRTGTRINDGKVDSSGRFWLGTMANEVNGHIAPNEGSLYRINDEFKPEKEVSPVSISNGLTWNLEDDIFYYIDSPTRQVAAYDYNPHNGKITNKRIVFDMNKTDLKGVPDGMTIDTNGNLWIALYGGSHVIHVNPKTGEVIRKIELPVENITSVTFGGPLLDILYVTTSSHGLTAEQRKATPEAGAVFAVKGLGVRGVLANTFQINRKHVPENE